MATLQECLSWLLVGGRASGPRWVICRTVTAFGLDGTATVFIEMNGSGTVHGSQSFSHVFLEGRSRWEKSVERSAPAQNARCGNALLHRLHQVLPRSMIEKPMSRTGSRTTRSSARSMMNCAASRPIAVPSIRTEVSGGSRSREKL